MKFSPRPRNDFAEFIETYFVRCRDRVPQIEGNAGKWTFEDLIPGLSDFDTRFFVNDAMSAEDWCRMSMEVGRVHLELARERKEWARNLEHLPGVNLKWEELFDPQQFFTEFGQWTFYHGDESKQDAARRYVAGREWSDSDAAYHWKKIAIYYGPYNRTIDPPINLGPYENKYSLHSRLMHYLAPPVHSAVSLMERTTGPGKIEAFRRARRLFPEPETIDLVLDLIGRHYEEPRYRTEPGVTELDARLDRYLTGMVNVLLDRYPLDCPRDATAPQLKDATRKLGGGVTFAQMFENVKFARLMKGRLWFYGQDVLWFDSPWLIRNELNRIRANFLETPVRLFVKLVHDRNVTAAQAMEIVAGEVFRPDQVEACRMFAQAARPECPPGELKPRAMEIASVFDPFFCAMEHLVSVARQRLPRSA